MHDVRIAYFVFGKKKVEVIKESAFLPPGGSGCPITGRRAPDGVVKCPPLRFGRMFDARAGFPPDVNDEQIVEELMKVADSLIELGTSMDDPPPHFEGDQPAIVAADEPEHIPAGYTYLGQFITHEITFDGTEGLPLVEPDPKNIRSPSLDLDSLYGAGPRNEKSKRLYEEGEHPARLKVGSTQPPPSVFSGNPSPFPVSFPNDLPRIEEDGKKGVAVIGDERNDENLPLAQTHLAFIKFHNRVVADLDGGSYKDFKRPAAGKLFDKAKAEVIKHFQWIILKDYLPRLVDEDIIESLIRKPSNRFNPGSKNKLFIPLEFSAAAFRIGHSMVRQTYVWNRKVKTVALDQLFTHTQRSGDLAGLDRLDSTWVIDWKRFYDFTPFADEYPFPYPYDPPQLVNKAGKIDTTFDLHLKTISGFQHLSTLEAHNGDGEKPDKKEAGNLLFNDQKALPVRNLLRGFALGLPWAEDVVKALKDEGQLTEAQCLTREELKVEPHAKLLDAFGEKTPLWFYVLREAKVKGNRGRLGRVGGRIVAETLIGLIRHSPYSILRRVKGKESEWELSDWRPAYPRKPTEPETFEMVDLLRAADVVDPLGLRVFQAEQQNPLP